MTKKMNEGSGVEVGGGGFYVDSPDDISSDPDFDIMRGTSRYGSRKSHWAAEGRAKEFNEIVGALGRDVTIADLDERDWKQLREAADAWPDTLSSESRPRLALLRLVGDVGCSAPEAWGEPLALATPTGRLVAETANHFAAKEQA